MLVKLETFKDIFDLSCSRVDEEEPEESIEIILKNAINFAYEQVVKKNKRFTTAVLPVINGIATLPDDCTSIEKLTPVFTSSEYRKGNAIFSDINTQFSIVYAISPEPLINDTDVPDVPKRFYYAMSSYACYVYFMFKKKPQITPMYLKEFQDTLFDIDLESDNIPEEVTNVYSSSTGGDIYDY